MPIDPIEDVFGDPPESLDVPGEELILTLHEPVLVLDAQLRVSVANSAFLMEFGLSDDEIRGRSVYALRSGAWRTAEVRDLLERVVPGRDLVEDHLLDLPGQGPFGSGYRVNARPLRTGANELRWLILAFRRESVSPEAVEEEPGSLRALAVEHGVDVVVLSGYRGAVAVRGELGAVEVHQVHGLGSRSPS